MKSQEETDWLKITFTVIGIIILVLLINLVLVLYLFGHWSVFD
jgi:hypothetical protein